MEAAYPIVVLAPLVGLIVDCVVQVGVARCTPGASPYRSMALGIVAGFVAATGVTWAALGRSDFGMSDSVAFFVLNASTYLALAWCYFNFVNATIASLRVRLLGELFAAGGVVPRADLLDRYGSRTVIAIRIDRLVRGGHLVERDGRFFIGKRRFLMVARFYNVLRRLVIGPWPHEDDSADAS